MLLRPLVEAAAIVGVNLHAPIVSADAGGAVFPLLPTTAVCVNGINRCSCRLPIESALPVGLYRAAATETWRPESINF